MQNVSMDLHLDYFIDLQNLILLLPNGKSISREEGGVQAYRIVIVDPILF
jgi:hypothetical protein